MNQKNKYLTTFTYGRGSKWYMGYGSVLLRLGGVRSQSPNQRLPYKLVDMTGHFHINARYDAYFGWLANWIV